jgi:hypothetical protein
MNTLQIYQMMSRDPFYANFLLGLRIVTDTQRRIYLSRLLQRSKHQILHLKRRLRDLIARYKSAKRASLLQSLAIRIDITEGIRNMVYETARSAADELSDILWRTTGEIVLITVDFDDEDNYFSDEDDEEDADMLDADVDTAFFRRF